MKSFYIIERDGMLWRLGGGLLLAPTSNKPVEELADIELWCAMFDTYDQARNAIRRSTSDGKLFKIIRIEA